MKFESNVTISTILTMRRALMSGNRWEAMGETNARQETIDLEDSEHDDVVYMAMVQESISEETRELR